VTASLLLSASAFAQGGGPGRKKLPVPSAEEQDKTEKLVKELFKEDYAKAEKNVEERRKLAEELAKSARDTGEDVTGRFVLWREARNLAARSGAATFAFSLIKEMNEEFAFDPLEAKAEVLALALPVASSAQVREDLLEVALDLVKLALGKDDLAAAEKCLEAIKKVLPKNKAEDLTTRGVALEVAIDLRKESRALRDKSLAQLKKNPQDPQANLFVGRYYGLNLGDWNKALPHLALGSEKELKVLAQKDLDRPKKARSRLHSVTAGGTWREKRNPACAFVNARFSGMNRPCRTSQVWSGLDWKSGLPRSRANPSSPWRPSFPARWARSAAFPGDARATGSTASPSSAMDVTASPPEAGSFCSTCGPARS
jgi:hypothetical protein